ncbi:MAG TPA: phosphodiester glycosidase family protein, partial [Kofleriaceae bacterium]
MRSLLVALLLVPTVAHATDTWTDPYPGVRRLKRVTTTQQIHVLKIDLCAPGVSVRATATGERQQTVGSFGSAVGAQAAVNGDFFNFDNYSTSGPAMSKGVKWGGTDDSFNAPVQFGPGQALLRAGGNTAGLDDWAREVVSGHPSIVVAGMARDAPNYPVCVDRHPRTALGLSEDNQTLFLAVVDGRQPGRAGMTCLELANLMKGLGAHDAVNLDGGGSSTMWLKSAGVVNTPSDGAQRVVANHLAIKATGQGPAVHCAAKPGATFAAVESPTELVSGEESVVWLEMTNAGGTTWDPELTRVGTQDAENRDSVFWKDGNWISASRPTGVDETTAPGAIGRFSWAMVAPAV